MWRDMGREGFEEAVYWLELLIKYGNLDHLKINDFDQSFTTSCSYKLFFLHKSSVNFQQEQL